MSRIILKYILRPPEILCKKNKTGPTDISIESLFMSVSNQDLFKLLNVTVHQKIASQNKKKCIQFLKIAILVRPAITDVSVRQHFPGRSLTFLQVPLCLGRAARTGIRLRASSYSPLTPRGE